MPHHRPPLSRPGAFLSASPAGRTLGQPNHTAQGWLKPTRQALGLTLQTVADRLKVSPQAVHQFEKSETAGTISLRQLQNVAGAMGCRVEYAVLAVRDDDGLPPAAPVAADRAAKSAPAQAEATAPKVEQSLMMENQAAGRFD
ncbi:MAG: helix-turn-helix domain-containing protein [Verrucomicrobia bacterium]|nr:helix-turn-helix domain-containing protein [Verrucomicrobiota bacterium]